MKTTKWLIHELGRMRGQIEYNIIVGGNGNNATVSAYTRTPAGFQCVSFVEVEKLNQRYFRFKEKDIKEIKSRLPEHLAKIVEMGKVEIEDK